MFTKFEKLVVGSFFTASMFCLPASAADWSDTSISWRYGETFREPFNGQKIKKNIFGLTHVSGYSYGSNFFNVDLLQSNSKDAAATSSSTGAQEAYIVYRHTLDYAKMTGNAIDLGVVNGAGFVLGFDWNTKNDSYASKKRMLVFGPTLMWKVPGFLNTSLLMLHESNAPGTMKRKTYDLHPAVVATWGIPLFSTPFSFEGFAMWIAKKGKNEFNRDTRAEFNLDAQVMWDVGMTTFSTPKKFRVGIAYQYWRNKFGNTIDSTIAAGGGSTASTPMVKGQYHF